MLLYLETFKYLDENVHLDLGGLGQLAHCPGVGLVEGEQDGHLECGRLQCVPEGKSRRQGHNKEIKGFALYLRVACQQHQSVKLTCS